MKLKNVQIVIPISKWNTLADVYCLHEYIGKTNWLREKFFIDINGKIVAHFQHKKVFMIEQLTPKHKNLFVIRDFASNNKEGYQIVQVNSDSIIPITKFYEDIELGVEDGCFAVQKNKLWGFINEDGVEIIKPQYEDYCAFSCGLAAVCKNGVWGFINKQNEIVIPFEYEISEYSCFNKNYAPVGKNNKFGFIDITGKIVIPLKYEDAGCVLENSTVFPVKLNGKWGLINENENIIIPFEYDDIEVEPNGKLYYSIIKYGNINENPSCNTYGLVDTEGQIIIPCEYNHLCPNKKSLCAGTITNDKQELYGLIDYNNNKITELIYDKMYDYSQEGLYVVKLNGKWGFIDETGKVVVDFQYYKVEHFCGGYAKVKDENYSEVVINRSGEIVIGPLPYRSIFNIGAGMFLVQQPEAKEYNMIKI